MQNAAPDMSKDKHAPVVSIRDVTHRYGKTLAVDNLSLDIPGGRMVGVIGPDGVGKSTLLALIAGSKKIQQGKVIVLGGDMADGRHRRDACPRIAYMPQGLGKNLYFELSVQENVDFMARLFGLSAQERPAKVKELLDATGLGPFPGRPAGKLSGGMKQKVGLCGALVHEPDPSKQRVLEEALGAAGKRVEAESERGLEQEPVALPGFDPAEARGLPLFQREDLPQRGFGPRRVPLPGVGRHAHDLVLMLPEFHPE